ncbi:glycosyltransferase family 2 protein [Agrobacterium sp. AGB01]|uniref:glycosyltransferase family 2 protein n=1 Tax=Agrobacterium sp. AGB01 TaxID=2769302 RepID=UPI0017812DE5|nr:glycosyltransferase family 2 protein [Agrobacterium sp. AGB01]MBD9388227.1 glycosyltransferase family 2 protein [Agrobacterium sp. AGB01]
MKISVLINNFNYARFLPACIDSVLAQDYSDFEIVVVDDGSTDNSREIIAGYGERIVSILKANGGQASSFNAGFSASSGDVLCMLDSDDTFLPGKLSAIAALFQNPDVDWVFDKVTTQENSTSEGSITATIVDKRETLRGGRFPSLHVPTSGLTFHRRILSDILPMPTAKDVVLSDNYLKFAAAYLGKGLIVETPLTFQRIHNENRYTNSPKAANLRAKIMVATGVALADRYDGLKKMGQSLAAGGLAQSNLTFFPLLIEARRCAKDSKFSVAPFTIQVATKRLAGIIR